MDHGALLKTLLHELQEGVIVCDPDAKITLFNRAAADLFCRGQSLCRGTSLYDLCTRPPLEQALSLLRFQHDLNNQPETPPYIQFINASISQEHFYRCRVSLLPSVTAAEGSFVIIFEDITAWYIPDNPLYMKIEEFRSPMTNLRAAVENLTEYPEMSPVMRSAFENVLVQESLSLTEAFNSFASSCRVIMQTQNHLAAMNTEVLFGYVAQHLQANNISVAASPDQTIGAEVDIFGLLLVLDFLVNWILQDQKEFSLSCAAHIGKHFIYFDLLWPGPFIPTTVVEKILAEIPAYSIGGMTVGAILHSMDGDIWSPQQENSQSSLRLALPIAGKADKST